MLEAMGFHWPAGCLRFFFPKTGIERHLWWLRGFTWTITKSQCCARDSQGAPGRHMERSVQTMTRVAPSQAHPTSICPSSGPWHFWADLRKRQFPTPCPTWSLSSCSKSSQSSYLPAPPPPPQAFSHISTQGECQLSWVVSSRLPPTTEPSRWSVSPLSFSPSLFPSWKRLIEGGGLLHP